MPQTGRARAARDAVGQRQQHGRARRDRQRERGQREEGQRVEIHEGSRSVCALPAARARARAASTMARLRSGGVSGVRLRAARSAAPRPRADMDLVSFACMVGLRLRPGLPAAAPGVAISSEMQSTGQAGMQSSQPVQCASITVCMRLWMPRIASVGHASRHSVQPMHQASSITASGARPFDAERRVDGTPGRPVSADRRATPSAPPGGHWSMPASPCAMACA